MADESKGAGRQLGVETMLKYVTDDRALQLGVARALEDLADTLPHGLEPRVVARLLATVEPSWSAHRAFQEGFLFPLIRRRHDGHASAMVQLELLQSEHVRIEGCNDEVVEQLSLSLSGAPAQADTLGYLLRNAFEARQRHVEWESATVVKLLPSVLAPAERGMLEAWIADQSGG